MTTYFDKLMAEIRDADLDMVVEVENQVVQTVSLACGDREFPHHMRELIMDCIACNQICPPYAESPDDKLANEKARRYFQITGSSKLISELHGLFHTLAGLHVDTRFGILQDDPQQIVKLRDSYDCVEEH